MYFRKGALTSLRVGDLPAAGAFDVAPLLEMDVETFSVAALFIEHVVADPAGACELEVQVSPVSNGAEWFPAEAWRDDAAVVATGEARGFPDRTARHRFAGTQHAPVLRVDVACAARLRVRAREVGAPGAPGALTVRARAASPGA